MSRLPVHLQEANQDAIWNGIRTLTRFTQADLVCWLYSNGHDSIVETTVKSYLERLTRGGYLSAEKTDCRNAVKRHCYELVRNTGVEAPRVNRHGEPVTQGRGREQLWRSMKVLGEFDYRELAAAASTEDTAVKEHEARTYCVHLAQADYLVVTQPAHNGGGLTRYRLKPSKNTGPKPPQVQRTKQIYDPNLKRVVWTEQREPA